MEFKLYKGYILGPGEQRPTYDIYEVDIYKSKSDVEAGDVLHSSESEWEAQLWIDREEETIIRSPESWATQADIDELNQAVCPPGVGDRIREGILLLVVDEDGVQLFNMPLGDYNVWEFDAQRELGKMIAEGLPGEAYKKR